MEGDGVGVNSRIPATFATVISPLDTDLGLEVHAACNRNVVDF